MRRGIFFILALAILLSGCTSGNGPGGAKIAQPTSTVGVDDPSKGKIMGTVMTDEELPIEGAGVAILGATPNTGLTATTDANGNFAFLGIEPGLYVLTAQKIGFEDFTRKDLQVVASDSTDVPIILVALPSLEPYSEVRNFNGLLSSLCYKENFSPSKGTYCFPLTACGNDCNRADDFWKTKEPATALQALVAELKWENTQFLAANMRYAVYPIKGGIGGATNEGAQFVNIAGPSILRGEANQAQIQTLVASGGNGDECNPDKKYCLIAVHVDGHVGNTNADIDSSLTLQQPFESKVATFYRMDAPRDFSSFI